MILTDKSLQKWKESTFTLLNEEQRENILERFGTEPEPYEWTEQDIGVQIRNYLCCGEWEKSVMNNGAGKFLSRNVEF